MPKPPVEPKLSATILLLRDGGTGLEVFMVERHHQIDFATGALVFPGGKVDPSDRDPSLSKAARGLDGLTSDEAASRIGAIRETFEEAGVLLAREHGSDDLLPAERLRALEDRYRDTIHTQATSLTEMVEREQLELACDVLVPFAHWITPEFMAKRFDTHFFLVPAPANQLALHDGVESVDSVWTTVDAALESARDGSRTIIFPTRLNLQKLGQSEDVGAAIDAARRNPIATVLPTLSKDADGNATIHLPAAAGYSITSAPLDDIMS
jgi:8-oxo-dGTP pyrophosphatase MutT (NUDIX family)